jgi:hypothetical protein
MYRTYRRYLTANLPFLETRPLLDTRTYETCRLYGASGLGDRDFAAPVRGGLREDDTEDAILH